MSLSRRSAVFTASSWVLTPPTSHSPRISSSATVSPNRSTSSRDESGLGLGDHDGAVAEADHASVIEPGTLEQIGPPGHRHRTGDELGAGCRLAHPVLQLAPLRGARSVAATTSRHGAPA